MHLISVSLLMVIDHLYRNMVVILLYLSESIAVVGKCCSFSVYTSAVILSTRSLPPRPPVVHGLCGFR